MPAAQLPLDFPDNWPDFVVTSHVRDKGTHASGNAVDIALEWTGDKSPSSPFWYYYIQTALMLWAAQRSGVTRAAVPPICPHFHIERKPDVSIIGLEFITKDTQGRCTFLTSQEYSKTDVLLTTNFANDWKYSIGAEYIATWQYVWEDMRTKYATVIIPKKKPRVNIYADESGKLPISEADLQSLLNQNYVAGFDKVLDDAAHLINYVNAPAASGAISGALLALGAGAVALWLLNRDTGPTSKPVNDQTSAAQIVKLPLNTF